MACTCLEPTPLVVAFVAHYVALGASEIRLFLDEPQPDLERLLKKVPQVRLTVCHEQYWQEKFNKSKPKAVEFRQLVNVFEAYKDTECDWLAHFDADEFLHADHPINDVLSAQPKEIDCVTVNVRERAFVEGELQVGIFDGVFRRPIPREWGSASFLFGQGRRFVNRGVLGYPHSKSILRTGQKLVPGIHSPRRPVDFRSIPLRSWPLLAAQLLHFDGLTGLHWSAKLLRGAEMKSHRRFIKKNGPDDPRAQQIIRMRKLGQKLQAAWDMHQALKTVPRDQLARLRTLSLVEDYTVDFAGNIEALGLGEAIDLSRSRFDALLARDQERIRAWLGPWEGFLAQASGKSTTE